MDEDVVTDFHMQGARGAVAAGFGHIEKQVDAIENAVEDNTGYVFDLARTLVESACRTVLTERGISYGADDDLPRLFRTVKNQLSFLPVGASDETEARRSLDKALSGLTTTIQGICELRNNYGFASHGTGAPRVQLETTQGILVAQAADAIVGFLYRMHRLDRTSSVPAPTEFTADEDYNAWIDDQHDTVHIFESLFRPCEVLFQMEPDSYRIYRAEFLAETDSDDDDTALGEAEEAAP